MKIIQITDCHLYADTHHVGYNNINPYQSLASVLQQVAKQNPELVIVSGDLSGDTSVESYRHFKHLWSLSDITAQLMLLPGNHDDRDIIQSEFQPHQLWLNSPLNMRKWHIHGLDTKDAGNRGTLTQAQQLTFQQQLASHPDYHHLVAVHHHPIACGGWMDSHEWTNRAEFVEIVSRYPQVRAVIYGHIHHENEQQLNHCQFLSCPSTCWQWAMQDDFAWSNTEPGFRLLELADDGSIFSKVLRVKQD